MQKSYSVDQARLKLEHFCAYQERCHAEVVQKLRALNMIPEAVDQIVVHLITHDFLNEERFARSFARGKHRFRYWGKIRIINELKSREISRYNIDNALKEITDAEYAATFHTISEKYWDNLHENNLLKKRKKFCDFLLRKGFESHLVYGKVKDLESGS